MPFQKIDGTVVTREDVTTIQNIDYNLHNVNSQNKTAHALSVQVVYTSGGAFNWELKLQKSNDGVNFADVTNLIDSPVTITANGNTVYEVGTVHYNFLRVVATPTSGTVTFTLIYNAINLD